MILLLEGNLQDAMNYARRTAREPLVTLEQVRDLRKEYEACCKDWPLASAGHSKETVLKGYRKLQRLARWMRLVQKRHYRTSALGIHMDHPEALRAMSWFNYRCAEEVVFFLIREGGEQSIPKRQRCTRTTDLFKQESPPLWAVSEPVGCPRLAISSLV